MSTIWKRHRGFFKIIASVLIFTFVLFDIAWAQGGQVQLAAQGAASSLYIPKIPVSVGSIQQIAHSKEESAYPTIYHIQDAHSVYSAQQNVSEIIRQLIAENKITTILVEGGTGDLSLSSLRKFAPKNIRAEVADRFLKEGKISAEEYLQVATDLHIRILGIEDEELYLQNLQSFIYCLRRQDSVLKLLSLIKNRLQLLEQQIYPQEFLSIDKERVKSRTGVSPLLHYVRVLHNEALEKNIDLSLYPQWSSVIASNGLQSIEGIDFRQFSQDLRAIEKQIQKIHLKDQQALELFKHSEMLDILERLFKLELLPEDYDGLVNSVKILDIQRIISFIHGSSTTTQKSLHKKDVQFLENQIPQFLQFYKYARKRDDVFISNINEIVEKEKLKTFVLITGGFHSDNLTRFFKNQTNGYFLISPAINEIKTDSKDQYERIIKEKIRKFTLRPPATVGTPVYLELQQALESSAQFKLRGKIQKLIAQLDVDDVIFDSPIINRSELRNSKSQIAKWFNFFLFFPVVSASADQDWRASTDAFNQMMVEILLGVLALSITLPFILKIIKRKKKSTDQITEPSLNKVKSETRKSVIRTNSLAVKAKPSNIVSISLSDYEKSLAEGTKKSLGELIIQIISSGQVTPPPYELPMPVPVSRFEDMRSPSQTLKSSLDAILSMMEETDQAVYRDYQEAIRVARIETEQLILQLPNDATAEDVFSLLTMGYRELYRTRMLEKLQYELSGVARIEVTEYEKSLQINDRVERQYPRMPRFVKWILSQHPELLQDSRIKAKIEQVNERMKKIPEVPNDIVRYAVEIFRNGLEENQVLKQKIHDAFSLELPHDSVKKITATTSGEPKLLPPPPADKQETASAPKQKKPDPEYVRLYEEKKRLSHEKSKLGESITAMAAQIQELEAAIENEGTSETIVVRALKKALKAKGMAQTRLEEQMNSLENSLNRINQALSGYDTNGIKLLSIAPALPVAFSIPWLKFSSFLEQIYPYLIEWLPIGAVFYLASSLMHLALLAIKRPSANQKRFPLKDVYKDLVRYRTPNYMNDDFNAATGTLGTLAGMIIGGVLLYHGYHSWEWDEINLIETADGNFTLTGLLWILEIFTSHFIGAIVGFVSGYLLKFLWASFVWTSDLILFPWRLKTFLQYESKGPEHLSKRKIKHAILVYANLNENLLRSLLTYWSENGDDLKVKTLVEAKLFKEKHPQVQSLFIELANFRVARTTSAKKHIGGNAQGFAKIDEWKEKIEYLQITSPNYITAILKNALSAETSPWGHKWQETIVEELLKLPKSEWIRGPHAIVDHFTQLQLLHEFSADLATKYGQAASINGKAAINGILASADPIRPIAVKKALPLMRAVLDAHDSTGFLYWLSRIQQLPKEFWLKSPQDTIAYYAAVRSLEMEKQRIIEKFKLSDKDQKQLDLMIAALGRFKDSSSQAGCEFASKVSKKLLEAPNGEMFMQVFREILAIEPKQVSGEVGILIHYITQEFNVANAISSLQSKYKASEKEKLLHQIDITKQLIKSHGANGTSVLLAIFKEIQGKNFLFVSQYLTIYQRFLQKFAIRSGFDTTSDLTRFAETVSVYLDKVQNISKGNTNAIKRLNEVELRLKLNSQTSFAAWVSVISKISSTPTEIADWNRFFLALPDQFLELVITNFDPVQNSYKKGASTQAWEELPEALNIYVRKHGQIHALSELFLDRLTDAQKDIEERVQFASELKQWPKLLKMGAPTSYAGVLDPVSEDDLIRLATESRVKSEINSYELKPIVAKMRGEGLYRYFEEQNPSYYRNFRKETSSLAADFNKPGEKFRVPYEKEGVEKAKIDKDEQAISDPVATVKSIISIVRTQYPNLYDNFIAPKREIIKDRPLEEFIDESSHRKVMTQLLQKLSSWTQIPEGERERIFIQGMEVLESTNLQQLRGQLQSTGDPLELLLDYWKLILKATISQSLVSKQTKIFSHASKTLRKRIDVISEKITSRRDGELEFYLSGKTFSDFLRGFASDDCTATRGEEGQIGTFVQTLGAVVDPSFLLFKVIDNGKWVGNIYSLVTKDDEGKTYLFIDMFSLQRTIKLTAVQKIQVAERFTRKIALWAGKQGLNGVILSATSSQRSDFGDPLRKAAQTIAKASQKNFNLKKVGGNSHFSDFNVSAEHVQNFGSDASGGSRSVSGYLIPPDSSIHDEEKRRFEIEELESVIKAMNEEEKRLLKVSEPELRDERLLFARIEEARKSGQQVVLDALAEELTIHRGSYEKIHLEIEELKREKQKREERLRQLKRSSNNGQSRSEVRIIQAYIDYGDFALVLFGGMMFAAAAALIFSSVYGWIRSLIKPEKREPLQPQANWYVPYYQNHQEELRELEELLADVVKDAPPALKERYGKIMPNLRNSFHRSASRLNAFRLLLEKLNEWGSVMPFMREQSYYKRFKRITHSLGVSENFDLPGTKGNFNVTEEETSENIPFTLDLSSRSIEDLFRGDVSCDCTSIQDQTAFLETIPQFMFDPGFLNFKVMMKEKWVGNVYLIVAVTNDQPILIIDAIQLAPWSRKWPSNLEEISDKIIAEVTRYAKENGFQGLYLSSFISNFEKHSAYLGKRYARSLVSVVKVGGFDHLKALDLWDPWNRRNQYLETFSPRWNQPIRHIDPNSPEQIIYLRNIWMRDQGTNFNESRSELRIVEPAIQKQLARKTPIKNLIMKAMLVLAFTGVFSNTSVAQNAHDINNITPTAFVIETASPFIRTTDIKKISWARDFGLGKIVGAIVELRNGRELIYGGSHGKDIIHFARDLGISNATSGSKDLLGRVITVEIGRGEYNYKDLLQYAESSQSNIDSAESRKRFNASDVRKIHWSKGTRGIFALGLSPVVGAVVSFNDGREVIYGGSHGNDLKYFAEDFGLKFIRIVERELIGTGGIAPRRAIKIEVELPDGKRKIVGYKEAYELSKNIKAARSEAPVQESFIEAQVESESVGQEQTMPQTEEKINPVIPKVVHTDPVTTNPAEDVIAEQEKEIAELEAVNAAQENIIDVLHAEKKQNEAELTQLQDAQTELKNNLAEMQKLANAKEKLFDTIVSRIDSVKDEISKWRAEAEANNRNAEALLQQNAELQDKVENLQETGQKSIQNLEQVQQELEQLRNTEDAKLAVGSSDVNATRSNVSIWKQPFYLIPVILAGFLLGLILYILHLKRTINRQRTDLAVQNANIHNLQRDQAKIINDFGQKIDNLQQKIEELLKRETQQVPPITPGIAIPYDPEKPLAPLIENEIVDKEHETFSQTQLAPKQERHRLLQNILQKNSKTYPVLTIAALLYLIETSGSLDVYRSKYGRKGLSQSTLRKDLIELGYGAVRDDTKHIGQKIYYYDPKSAFAHELSEFPDKEKTILEKGRTIEQSFGLIVPPTARSMELANKIDAELKNMKRELKKQNAKLRGRKATIARLLKERDSALKESSNQWQVITRNLEEQHDAYETEIQALKKLIELRESEIGGLKAQLEALDEQQAQDISVISTALRKSENAYNLLKRQKNALASEYKREILRASQRLKRAGALVRKIKKESAQTIRDRDAQAGRLKTALERAEQTREQDKKAYEDLIQRIKTEKDEEIRNLNDRLQHAIKENNLYALEQVTLELQKTERMRKALLRRLERARQEHYEELKWLWRRIRAKDAALLRITTESKALQRTQEGKKSNVRKRMARLIELVRQRDQVIRELQGELKRVQDSNQAEITTLNSRFDALNEEDAVQRKELIAEIESLKDQNAFIEAKNKAFRQAAEQQLKVANTRLLRGGRSVSKQIRDLKRVIQLQAEELESVRAMLAVDKERDQSVKQHEPKLQENHDVLLLDQRRRLTIRTATKSEIDRLRKIKKQLSETEAAQVEQKNEFDQLEQRVNVVQDQLNKTAETLDVVSTESISTEENLANLRRQQKELMSRVEQLDAEYQEKIRLIEESQRKLDEMKDDARTVESAVYDEIKRENERLQSEVAHLIVEKEVLSEKIAVLEARPVKTDQVIALQASESLEAILSEVPDLVWDMFAKHFPGHERDAFKLTIPSITQQLQNAWSSSDFFKQLIKNLVLHRSLYKWFQTQKFYAEFKDQARKLKVNPDFDTPGEKVTFRMQNDSRNYSLYLSPRDAEYLLRGFFSGDCTNCGPHYVTSSFIRATGSHIVDPGFFNFKVLRDGEWIGNVYVMAIVDNGKPALVIDAIQLPFKGVPDLWIPDSLRSHANFPISENEVFRLAEGVINALKIYSEHTGFQELWLSKFVSNFHDLKSHFERVLGPFDGPSINPQMKMGGWSAQRSLGFPGDPYVESLGRPTKKVWSKPFVHQPRQADSKHPTVEKKDRIETKIDTETIAEQLTHDISRRVQSVYLGNLSKGSEFIVQVPGEPVRWISYDNKKEKWQLYEGTSDAINQRDIANGLQPDGTINLANAEIKISMLRRVPLPAYLRLPPLSKGRLETYLEVGGFIIEDKGILKSIPFERTGFIVSGGAAAFFVHPGSKAIDEKQNIQLPLESPYTIIKRQYPESRFILGWHTNPAGDTQLHGEEEREIFSAEAEGFQLVFSPKGVSLIQYFKEQDGWKKKVHFTKSLSDGWQTDLEAAIRKTLTSLRIQRYASGYQSQTLVDQALDNAELASPIRINQKLLLKLQDKLENGRLSINYDHLRSFIEDTKIEYVMVTPKDRKRFGLGIFTDDPGRDTYATYKYEEGHLTIYVGRGIWDLAGEDERFEIMAHELYEAYKRNQMENEREFPVDIDLEIAIDREIQNAQAWEQLLPENERIDLGLIAGDDLRLDPHVRARAFARLLGLRSLSGEGTTYTDLLRKVYRLSHKSNTNDWMNGADIPAIESSPDDFQYTQDPQGAVFNYDDMESVFQVTDYIRMNKDEDISDYVDGKLHRKNVIFWNYNGLTPWILKDLAKIIRELLEKRAITQIYFDLPERAQASVDQFLRTGEPSAELVKAIESRFPPFLPREFHRPDLYLNILRQVFEFNLDEPANRRIAINTYYREKDFPMPVRMPQGFPRPAEIPPMENLDIPDFEGFVAQQVFPGMPRFHDPLANRAQEGIFEALLNQATQEQKIFVLKPIDDLLPASVINHDKALTMLHIDRYTGFGPQKPENKLALYISQQASPNEKSFALPIFPEAPFYNEEINAIPKMGGRKGIKLPFNQFKQYPHLVLSIQGDDGDNEFTTEEPMPEDEGIKGPFVPVPVGFPRSELRMFEEEGMLERPKPDPEQSKPLKKEVQSKQQKVDPQKALNHRLAHLIAQLGRQGILEREIKALIKSSREVIGRLTIDQYQILETSRIESRIFAALCLAGAVLEDETLNPALYEYLKPKEIKREEEKTHALQVPLKQSAKLETTQSMHKQARQVLTADESALVHFIEQNGDKDISNYVSRQLSSGKNIVLWSYNGLNPNALYVSAAVLAKLIADLKIDDVFLDLPESSARSIQQFLQDGSVDAILHAAINARFPFLPEGSVNFDQYLSIIEAVGKTRSSVKLHPYIQSQNARHIPLPPTMAMPHASPSADLLVRLVSKVEQGSDQRVLVLKPMEDLVPEQISRHPSIISILHLDSVPGVQPGVSANLLSKVIQESNGKYNGGFAMPMSPNNPLRREEINLPPQGIPRIELPFNYFKAYDHIVATQGQVATNRSELRFQENPALIKRQEAMRELVEIGRPAVPALMESLTIPSITLRLGAIQILGAIGDQRAVTAISNLSSAAELREAARIAVESINSKNLKFRGDIKSERRELPQTFVPSVVKAANSFVTGVGSSTQSDVQKLEFIRTLLKDGPITIDIDIESLLAKDEGIIQVLGWGFVEAIHLLENELREPLVENIRIRLINLNPAIKSFEIQQAFDVSPVLRNLLQIVNVPTNHTRFDGVHNFLGKESIKIVSEKNKNLWDDEIDILVRTPQGKEVIDGRRLFLASLIHSKLKRQLPDKVKEVVEQLLKTLNTGMVDNQRTFYPEDRSHFDAAFIQNLERINQLLQSSA